jgi:outer membrane protein OmpA-like peptidoglycan-associated protein
MKRLLFISACCALFAAQQAHAQQDDVVIDVVDVDVVQCRTNYYSTNSSNWFMQFGAGVSSPFVEYSLDSGKAKHHLTAAYNLGFGKWISPYMGWRIDMLGGALHWDTHTFSKAKYVTANLDFMWNMLNSVHGVNTSRVFSLVPFVGLGGTFCWDYHASAANDVNRHGKVKRNQWTLPVSAGLQLKFRLCRTVDFFMEGRAQFYGDNFNNTVYGRPIDICVSAVGGLTVKFGGDSFKFFNPCDYMSYIGNLNNQVNELRDALAATTVALAAAEAQLPCPEAAPIPPTDVVVLEQTPLMATVRFAIDSSAISAQEQVNVYNVAQWMQQNPEQNVVILGYADRDTGTADYNMTLSQRRAQAVMSTLVNDYGIDSSRLSIKAEGSSVQPYDVNNWNRIVIFSIQ